MAEHTKDFNQAKSDLATALLESINGISRVKAEQQLSSNMVDLWNGLEVRIRRMTVKVGDEQRLRRVGARLSGASGRGKKGKAAGNCRARKPGFKGRAFYIPITNANQELNSNKKQQTVSLP